MCLGKNKYQRLGIILSVASLCLILNPAAAQKLVSTETEVLHGIVIDASNGRSVGNSLVKIVMLDKTTRTDPVGQFEFSDITFGDGTGKITLEVLHHSYKKLVKTIDLNNADMILLELERKPRLQ